MENEENKSNFTIIENTRKAQDEYGHNYGSDTYYISKEDIQALLDGKQLACGINGDEYSLFIKMNEEELKLICNNLKGEIN